MGNNILDAGSGKDYLCSQEFTRPSGLADNEPRIEKAAICWDSTRHFTARSDGGENEISHNAERFTPACLNPKIFLHGYVYSYAPYRCVFRSLGGGRI